MSAEKWRVKFGIRTEKDYQWHVRETEEIRLLKPEFKGMPAILEKPVVDGVLYPVVAAFNMLQQMGDFSAAALSKVYDLMGVFDELAFFEIMLDTRAALEAERVKQNG